MRKLLIFLLLSGLVYSFPFQKKRDGIIINGFEGQFNNPLSGGFNNPEHQFTDIDNDGDYDLFILNSDGYFTFLRNTGTATTPEFSEEDFPAGLSFNNWFFFCDINNDGLEDCFTGGAENYVSLYLNNTISGELNFELASDTLLTATGEPLTSESVSNPALADIDSDGDFDYFITDQSGRVIFYENTGGPDAYQFTFVTDSWQDILIVGGGKSAKHGAASIEFCDIDNDNDPDLFWGDFFSGSLYFIKNNGNSIVANMSLESDTYPVNNPVSTSGFNMPRFADIDGDGDLDLFVSVLYDPTVPQGMIFFENAGTSSNPEFEFVTDRYLSTFDVGTKSVMTFADMDNDFDYDLIIGTEKNPDGALYYLENTGNHKLPEFTLRDTMFAGYQNDLSVAPTAGDLDGDGDYDILVGTFLGDVMIITNTGTRENPVFGVAENLLDHLGNKIKFSNYSRPCLLNLDLDNDLDLVIGGFNGKLTAYINEGSETGYMFVENTSIFDGVDLGDMSNVAYSNSDPNSAAQDLVVGNRNGELYLLKDSGLGGQIKFDSPELMAEIPFEGREVAPSFVDINMDGDEDMFLGSVRGGITYYENKNITNLSTQSGTIPSSYTIGVYPNPFNGGVNIVFTPVNNDRQLEVYDITGRLVHSASIDSGSDKYRWNPSANISSGVYFVVINHALRETLTQKILYLK